MDNQQGPFHPFGICQKVFKFITRLFSPQSGGKTKPHKTDQDSSKDDIISLGSALQVHFKQSEDHLHNLYSSSSILVESAETTQIHDPLMYQTQVGSRRGAAESAVSIKHPRQENKTEDEKITVPIDTEKPKLKYHPHLISVAPNINEKSESFIKTRIEAMRRDFGSDDPRDS